MDKVLADQQLHAIALLVDISSTLLITAEKLLEFSLFLFSNTFTLVLYVDVELTFTFMIGGFDADVFRHWKF